jgi:hypothetical protein
MPPGGDHRQVVAPVPPVAVLGQAVQHGGLETGHYLVYLVHVYFLVIEGLGERNGARRRDPEASSADWIAVASRRLARDSRTVKARVEQRPGGPSPTSPCRAPGVTWVPAWR